MLGLFFLYFTGISHLIIPPSLSYVIPKVYGHLYCRLHCLKTYSLGAFDIIFKCQSHHDHQRQRGSYNGGPQSQKSHMPVESSVRCSGVYVPSSGHFRLDVQTKVFSFFFFNKLYYYLTYSWKIHPTKTHLDSVTGDQPVLFLSQSEMLFAHLGNAHYFESRVLVRRHLVEATGVSILAATPEVKGVVMPKWTALYHSYSCLFHVFHYTD